MSISEYAIVSEKARIGANVVVGPYTIIHANVELQDNCIIGAYCELGISNHLSCGENLVIGKGSHIRSHSVFYEGSKFGPGLITGHRVTVREKTMVGDNFQIGTLSDIQGHCKIGDHVRIFNNVHIAQHADIGDFVWMFPYVVLTNDPHPPSEVVQGVTVQNFAVIATMSVILPGAIISEGCLIGAHSSISGKTVKDTIYAGSPGKKLGPTSNIKLKDGTGRSAYPWRKHFHRGYPQAVVDIWCNEKY